MPSVVVTSTSMRFSSGDRRVRLHQTPKRVERAGGGAVAGAGAGTWSRRSVTAPEARSCRSGSQSRARGMANVGVPVSLAIPVRADATTIS